jgi:hypothetical protein
MHETFACNAITHPEVLHELDRILLEYAGAHSTFRVLAIALLDRHAFDSERAQQKRQKHTCRSRADDANLSTHAEPLPRMDPRTISLDYSIRAQIEITC